MHTVELQLQRHPTPPMSRFPLPKITRTPPLRRVQRQHPTVASPLTLQTGPPNPTPLPLLLQPAVTARTARRPTVPPAPSSTAQAAQRRPSGKRPKRRRRRSGKTGSGPKRRSGRRRKHQSLSLRSPRPCPLPTAWERPRAREAEKARGRRSSRR